MSEPLRREDMNSYLPYAGIGSRETPDEILRLMEAIACALGDKGYTLRSGAAKGADSAFENGARHSAESPELYLPWADYESRVNARLDFPTERALQIAAEYHPAWHRCSNGARLLHGRNSHIILGADCRTPAQFVIAWTKDGQNTGGTGQGLRIAKHHGVPIFNLHDEANQLRMLKLANIEF